MDTIKTRNLLTRLVAATLSGGPPATGLVTAMEPGVHVNTTKNRSFCMSQNTASALQILSHQTLWCSALVLHNRETLVLSLSKEMVYCHCFSRLHSGH
jgi:hypothetical protein